MTPIAAVELETVAGIASAAGDLLLEHFHHSTAASAEMKGRRNLVTAADRASEALIRAGLAAAFPGDRILGEEEGGERETTGRLWIVDPLDGTTNFAHELPLWAVSIGLVVDGRPELGVVHVPLLRESFTAARAQGASLNGEPIAVTATSDPVQALCATGFAYERNSLPANNTGNFTRVVMASRDVRRGGAAACDLAYTACGRFDAFWELYLQPWDVAAGALLVQEAGGRVTDIHGGDDWLFGDSILATGGPLHERMLGMLRFE